MTNNAAELNRRVAEELGYYVKKLSNGWWGSFREDGLQINMRGSSTEEQAWMNYGKWPRSVDAALSLPIEAKRYYWELVQYSHGGYEAMLHIVPDYGESTEFGDRFQYNLAEAIVLAWLSYRANLRATEQKGGE